MQKSKTFKFSFIITIIFVSIVACSPENNSLPSATQIITLKQYQTATMQPTSISILTEAQPTPPPLPTPTPLQYTIQSGDNLSTIAYRFGITLDQIYLANPGISSTLSIGQTINIPSTNQQENESLTLSSEMLPLDLSIPICYPSSTPSLWCLVNIKNNTESTAENITVDFYLYDQNNNLITNQTATTPSNILPPQKSTVASYYFTNLTTIDTVTASLNSAIPSQNTQQRYLVANLNQPQINIDNASQTATIQGTLELSSTPTAYAWVIAIAYNQNHTPIGYRLWEAPQLSQQIPVNFTVYSLAGSIESVEIITESR